MMRTSARLLAIASVLVVASAAHADPPRDRADDSRIGATLGLFTPTGELALEYTQVLHENFEVGVGVGAGLVRVGPQVSVMPRLRVRRGSLVLSLGAGLSAGRYNNISAFQDASAPHILSLFGNVEGGLQITSQRGPFVRGFVGAGRIVAHGNYDQTDPAQRAELEDVIPYGGLTVGWTS